MTKAQQKNLLEQAVKAYSKVLQSFPKLANGMHSDEVKFSREFVDAKANYHAAFEQLRRLNGAR